MVRDKCQSESLHDRAAQDGARHQQTPSCCRKNFKERSNEGSESRTMRRRTCDGSREIHAKPSISVDVSGRGKETNDAIGVLNKFNNSLAECKKRPARCALDLWRGRGKPVRTGAETNTNANSIGR